MAAFALDLCFDARAVGLLVPALLLLLSVPLVVAMMRANELFVLRIEGAELVRVRGRIPQRLLADLADILGHSGLHELELRCVIEDGKPKLYAPGRDDIPRAVRQQLRNAIGQWQTASIRQAPRPRGTRLSSPANGS
ncbi:MAG: DUF3634 family protein [Deltaproteobacteria bacterium]|nr:DUF3634 family protein [Deltaproteobacteria bacterium]